VRASPPAARAAYSTCRSCDAPIVWATTENDRPIPLDVEPVLELLVDPGLFLLDAGVARAVPREIGRLVLCQSHFASCPNAAEHRSP
jgi:hypothetical protein